MTDLSAEVWSFFEAPTHDCMSWAQAMWMLNSEFNYLFS